MVDHSQFWPWSTMVRTWSEEHVSTMVRTWSEERVSTMFWQWWPFNVDVWNMVKTRSLTMFQPWSEHGRPCFDNDPIWQGGATHLSTGLLIGAEGRLSVTYACALIHQSLCQFDQLLGQIIDAGRWSVYAYSSYMINVGFGNLAVFFMRT